MNGVYIGESLSKATDKLGEPLENTDLLERDMTEVGFSGDVAVRFLKNQGVLIAGQSLSEESATIVEAGDLREQVESALGTPIYKTETTSYFKLPEDIELGVDFENDLVSMVFLKDTRVLGSVTDGVSSD